MDRSSNAITSSRVFPSIGSFTVSSLGRAPGVAAVEQVSRSPPCRSSRTVG